MEVILIWGQQNHAISILDSYHLRAVRPDQEASQNALSAHLLTVCSRSVEELDRSFPFWDTTLLLSQFFWVIYSEFWNKQQRIDSVSFRKFSYLLSHAIHHFIFYEVLGCFHSHITTARETKTKTAVHHNGGPSSPSFTGAWAFGGWGVHGLNTIQTTPKITKTRKRMERSRLSNSGMTLHV